VLQIQALRLTIVHVIKCVCMCDLERAKYVTVPNFVEIGRTVAEVWRFKGFENGGRPPSWIL